MESVFFNGGFIGKTFDFADTSRYVIQATSLQYVGGRVQGIAGQTGNYTLSLTGLTGGLASAPAEGDLVIVAMAVGDSTSTAALSYRISGFTEVANLFSDDTGEVCLQVGYKRMGATPDTSVTITGGTGGTAEGGAFAVHVWRGVDSTTPLDVTSTTSTRLNTTIPDPPAITPTTVGAQIIVIGGGMNQTNTGGFAANYASNFISVTGNDTYDATIGMGSVAWTSGAYNPAAFLLLGGADNTQFAAAAVTMALRPATPAIFGNQKNSGIWALQSVYDSF